MSAIDFSCVPLFRLCPFYFHVGSAWRGSRNGAALKVRPNLRGQPPPVTVGITTTHWTTSFSSVNLPALSLASLGELAAGVALPEAPVLRHAEQPGAIVALRGERPHRALTGINHIHFPTQVFDKVFLTDYKLKLGP